MHYPVWLLVGAAAFSCSDEEFVDVDTDPVDDPAFGPGDGSSNENPASEADLAPSTPAGEQPRAGCGEWRSRHPDWLWCDDFETESDLSVNYQDVNVGDAAGMTVSVEDAFSGTHSLRQRYRVGQVDAGWVSRWYADANGGDRGPPHDEIYVRWYHKFGAGFQGVPPKMARLRSLGPGYDKRFAVHYWIDSNSEDREIVADVRAPFSTQANSGGWLPVERSGFSYSDPANIGRWSCHEMYVKTNTPGAADGIYRFWADGELVLERTGVDLRGSTDFNFNEALLDGYWNGGSPAEQNRYYDDFVMATARIGCGEAS